MKSGDANNNYRSNGLVVSASIHIALIGLLLERNFRQPPNCRAHCSASSDDFPSPDCYELETTKRVVSGGGVGAGSGGGVSVGHGPGVGAGTGGSIGDGVYHVGGGISAPEAISTPDPKYTEDARRAKMQGTCVLWLIVDSQGCTRDIRVVRGLGYGLDAKAVDALRQWCFQPSVKDGKPVDVQITVEVSFRL